MLEKTQSRPDLLILLSLLLVILMHPVLDHGDIRRLVLAGLIFVPVFLATFRLSEIKGLVWPSVLLMAMTFTFGVVSVFWPSRTTVGMKWVTLAAFFGFAVAGLFSYLKNSRSVTDAHLYTAVSIYLLLGMLWFSLYCAVDIFYPGAIQLTAVGQGPAKRTAVL